MKKKNLSACVTYSLTVLSRESSLERKGRTMMWTLSFYPTTCSFTLGSGADAGWNDHWAALCHQKQDKWERWLKMAAKGDRRMEGEEVMGWGRRTEIQLACILLPIQINPFHLRAHQLSNWESDGDVRAARISTRPEVGAPLRPNQNTITFTARPDSCSNTIFFFFFFTQTLLDKCTYNHAHTEKYINFKSHMDKHILSRAIALWPISNYPQHRGRKMMYKTQFNILSYLWLWPMTGLSPLYSSSFQKLHLGGRLLAWKTKRQQLRLHIWAGSNAS